MKVLFVSCLLLMLLVGCAPPASSPDAGAQWVLITGHDAMRFEPSSLTIDAGSPVRLVFENKGRLVHDASFSDASGLKLSAAGNASASSRPLTFEQPGSYRFVCSQP